MFWQLKCIYCNDNLYRLQENALKCVTCKRKYAKRKTNKTVQLIELFCQNRSALDVATQNGLSYASVRNYFETFRLLCAQICEREYETIRHKSNEYEEYFYLERSKRHKKEAIFDAKNFLTFDYAGHIYTILLPSLHKYKAQFIEDNLTDNYLEDFKRFRRQTRLIKVASKENRIIAFWSYFESFILHYKGVENDTFGYFLKECEFKFNHGRDEAVDLLIREYFQ